MVVMSTEQPTTGTANEKFLDALDLRGDGDLFGELSQPQQRCLAEEKEDSTEVPLVALEEDFVKVPGQNFAVLSFIDSLQYKGLKLEGHMSLPMHLIKVRGVFKTLESAEAHVKLQRKMDAHFDYHIVTTHKWTTIGAHMASEQEWESEIVNSNMQSYFEKQDEVISDMTNRVRSTQQQLKSDRASSAADVFENAKGIQPRDACSSDFADNMPSLVPQTLKELTSS